MGMDSLPVTVLAAPVTPLSELLFMLLSGDKCGLKLCVCICVCRL